MFNVFNHLLAILCMVDLVVLLTNLMVAAKAIFPHSIFNRIAPYSDSLCHVSITTSVFLVMALTLERFYAICFAHTYQQRLMEKGNWRIVLSYIIPAILFAVLFNLPKMLYVSNLISEQHLSDENHQYNFIKIGIIYQVFHPFITTCIVPLGSLSYLNYRIFLGSKRLSVSNSQQQEISLAKIMVVIVSVFLILNLPKMCLTIYEVVTIPSILECYKRQCDYIIPSEVWVLDSFVRYFLMANSSINVVVYCFAGSKFRTTLMETIFSLLRRFSRPHRQTVVVDSELVTNSTYL